MLLESGIASGREPTETRSLTSYVAQFLAETKTTLGAADEQPFPMTRLHFRRTFVEKLFAIHGKVEKSRREGIPLGSYARRYYDLYQLAGQAEVRAMLASPEYRQIQADYDAISREHFPRDYAFPDGMDFTKSEALFPSSASSAQLGREYVTQCRQLCFGSFPTWEEVLARFAELRELLRG